MTAIASSSGASAWFNDWAAVPPKPVVAVGGTAQPVSNAGGGNLNGSANTAHLIGQAGTAGTRIAVPRQNARNYTGVV